ncbi:hypothetical protein [Dipodfec virus UOA04_Rod_718]|nr:hypothetical protein [Dipodfec virus UOA04_Rod_718]
MKFVGFSLMNSCCEATVEVPSPKDVYFGFAHYSKTTLANYLKSRSSKPFQMYYQDICPDSLLTFSYPDILEFDDTNTIYFFIPGYSSDFSDLFTHPLKFNSFLSRDISVVFVCNDKSRINKDTILNYLKNNISFGTDCDCGVCVEFSLIYFSPVDGSVVSSENLCSIFAHEVNK